MSQIAASYDGDKKCDRVVRTSEILGLDLESHGLYTHYQQPDSSDKDPDDKIQYQDEDQAVVHLFEKRHDWLTKRGFFGPRLVDLLDGRQCLGGLVFGGGLRGTGLDQGGDRLGLLFFSFMERWRALTES